MPLTIKLATDFEITDCPTCSIEFAVPVSFTERRRKDARTFYCPNQHPMSWTKSEADKLREQLAAMQGRLTSAQGTITHLRDQAAASERSARAQRAANTKLRKRVANGVCPCCKRSFADLLRHMAGQHPDYVEAGGDGE